MGALGRVEGEGVSRVSTIKMSYVFTRTPLGSRRYFPVLPYDLLLHTAYELKFVQLRASVGYVSFEIRAIVRSEFNAVNMPCIYIIIHKQYLTITLT